MKTRKSLRVVSLSASSLVVYCLQCNLNVLYLHDSTQCYKQRTTLFQPQFVVRSRRICLMRNRTGTSAPSSVAVRLKVGEIFLFANRKFYFLSVISGYSFKQVNLFHQKHITPKRLNSPYLFRNMLGFFSRRSRPIRSTQNCFAQIWNQSIEALSFKHACLSPKEIVPCHKRLITCMLL